MTKCPLHASRGKNKFKRLYSYQLLNNSIIQIFFQC